MLDKVSISKDELYEYIKRIVQESISDKDLDFRKAIVESLKTKGSREKKTLKESIGSLENSFKISKAIEYFTSVINESSTVKDKLYILNNMMRIRLDEKSDTIPHMVTGINILEDLLKKIIPVIEKDYKMLTTDKMQRDSYRAHIINALEAVITSENLNNNIELPDKLSESLITEQEVDAEQLPATAEPAPETSEEDKEKFIDVAELRQRSDMRAKKEKEDVEYKLFSLSDHDETGRNVAFKTFKKIQNQIVDQYNVLADERDKELFFDYLLANVKLYFDRFEEEVSVDLPEPTNQEYEDFKDNGEIDGSIENEMSPEENPEEEFFPENPDNL